VKEKEVLSLFDKLE